MANNKYTVMELEAIKKLCKCVNSVASLPADLIADTNVATNTTYSSYKIDVEMSALETDIQAYVDTALAGLNKLTKEVIDDKALVVKENVLYLYKDPTDINNDYMQMMLINGVAIELGSTTCDMSSVYNKDEVDDKFALKIDLDVLTTSFNNLVTSVDKKIDKDNIATVLDDSVTDEQVASALLTKTELDKVNASLGELSDSLVDKQDFRVFKSLEEFNEKKGTSFTVVSGVDNMADIIDAMTEGDILIITTNYITGSEIYFGLDSSTGWTKMFKLTRIGGLCDIKCVTSAEKNLTRVLAGSTLTSWQKIATQKDLDELFQSVSSGKTLVANAITGKGVSTATNATFATMATNIGKISGGYKEETKSKTFSTSGISVLTITFSANVLAIKQIIAPSDSCSIVPQTSKDMFTINGKELTLYVTGSGTWKITALIKQ